MNKALKLLQSRPARPLNDFYNASPCRTCASSYQKWSNSCIATPFPTHWVREGGDVIGGKLTGIAQAQAPCEPLPQRPFLAPLT